MKNEEITVEVPAVRSATEIEMAERSVDAIVAQRHKVQDAMKRVMKEGEHYGTIPGTNKPTLYKAGAEVLMSLFYFDPEYESVDTYHGQPPYMHLTVKSKCILYHSPTGRRLGSGEGSCSTMEEKYAWRKGGHTCPDCGVGAIIKGKAEFGGGWLCWKKQGGCGSKFPDSQFIGEPGRIPNDNLPDLYNTVLKMANKRALIAATLNVTAASDLFTQDLEDMPHIVNPGPTGGGFKAADMSKAPESADKLSESAKILGNEIKKYVESHLETLRMDNPGVEDPKSFMTELLKGATKSVGIPGGCKELTDRRLTAEKAKAALDKFHERIAAS